MLMREAEVWLRLEGRSGALQQHGLAQGLGFKGVGFMGFIGFRVYRI